MYEELDFEIKQDCPICKSTLRVNVTCEVDCSATIHADDYTQNDFLNTDVPREPYKPLLPNLGAMTSFTVSARLGDEPIHCDGYYFLLGSPPFVYRVTEQETPDKDWTEQVNKWRASPRAPLTPAYADNGRVCFTRPNGTTLVAQRNHVDLFRTMRPECVFEGPDLGEGIITVHCSGRLLGGFVPIYKPTHQEED